MQSPARQPNHATEIGRYRLVAELARGGMGIVHLAVSQGPGGFSKLLVVKELKPELARDDTYVSMFLDEARLAARLGHPNIVQTIEVGSEGSRHYMVMEYLDGRSLHRTIRRFRDTGGFPVGAHLRCIAESLLGLHHAHELVDFDGQPLGIVHRDVSPLNVFVTFDGQAKVIDFGIAKSVDSSLETKTGILKGRVAYMAPEQAWGHGVDRRSDVYSCGVMLWEAAAGRRLWPGMSDVEILARILREAPPTLRSVRPDAPEDLEAICARAMERRPEDRYATTIELLEDLEAHLATRDDAASMREVGALVGRAFAEERRRTNALIEETLSHARTGPRSGVMPTLDLHVRGTPSGAAAGAEDASALSSRMILASPFDVVMPPSQGSLLPANSGLLSAVSTPPPPWWASRRAVIAAAASAAFLVLAGVVLLAGSHEEPAAPGARGAVTAAGVLPVADVPELVEVTVRVSPPGATVTIDGATVQSLPFHARVTKDALVHHVAATADGYEPRTVDVTFASDVSVDVSLDRRPPPPAVRWVPAPVPHPGKHSTATAPSSAPALAPPSPPQPAPAPAEVTPAGGHAPLRPISTSNPYGSP